MPLTRTVRSAALLLAAAWLASCAHLAGTGGRETESARPLTVVAVGDGGEPGAAGRQTASLVTAMQTGQHDGGTFDALFFLGNMFSPTGLNLPVGDVEGRIRQTLDPYAVALEGVGRDRVHAIPGNQDYYARNAIEASVLFGLISIAELPVGLAGRGNERAAAIGRWTYHTGLPGQCVLPLHEGARDSAQFFFVDSALPLRTDSSTWHAALDSLERLLADSRTRPGIRWRILCMHHPFVSLGEHGGYSVWDDEKEEVEYLPPCDRDSNVVAWIRNQFDPEDLCAEKYRAFLGALRSVLHRSGAGVHAVLSAHDRSMQILFSPEPDAGCPECPPVQIISGAGSQPALVRAARGPLEYTSAPESPGRRGISPPGFVQLAFFRDEMRVVFFDAQALAPLDMGGRTEFTIHHAD